MRVRVTKAEPGRKLNCASGGKKENLTAFVDNKTAGQPGNCPKYTFCYETRKFGLLGIKLNWILK